ncbi:MAG: hypothetical protein IJ762_02575 [Bacteroidaceae bacterium]|nr:hypothetical protein [Bacteroidaceae bacterium]
MSEQERPIIKDLNRDIAIQSTECGKNCRRVVFAIFAATWGFLIKENSLIGRLGLSVILLVGVAYLIVETWRYYSTAKEARALYKNAKSLSDDYID